MEALPRRRSMFEHRANITYRPVRTQSVVKGALASLLEALLRMHAAQVQQAAHLFLPMPRMVLLHQLHELDGWRTDLIAEALDVILGAVRLFVRRQVCVLRNILPLAIEYAVQGDLLCLVRYAQQGAVGK